MKTTIHLLANPGTEDQKFYVKRLELPDLLAVGMRISPIPNREFVITEVTYDLQDFSLMVWAKDNPVFQGSAEAILSKNEQISNILLADGWKEEA